MNSNCSNVSELPSITFILDGIEYTLNAEEYVLRDDGKTQTTVEASKSTIKKDSFLEAYASCVSSFMAMDIPNDEIGFQYEKAWILVKQKTKYNNIMRKHLIELVIIMFL